ncbi:MFS transporter [Shewanella surugensis]|uniref:MFS transporter n=1 Tax=Shewanella surugensis TaxID=212020 RepID=A0ABT0LJ45_9GAMM|nr:MFS transporter [Shewanella surugensis]MCL1127713.1 MFS transporter [Shewanella surugensis]
MDKRTVKCSNNRVSNLNPLQSNNRVSNLNPLQSNNGILLALAMCAFCIGTTEFVMAGVLSDIANTFKISVSAAGWLMSGYAFAVVISAPILTAVSINLPRKPVLISLMGLFILGSLISALSPSYQILMLGRIISAFCHGAFLGIGSVVAAHSAPKNKQAHAIALMFTGLTLANVLGMPLGTTLSQYFGWRSMFWVISVLGCISLISLIILIPNNITIQKTHLKHEIIMFKNPFVWRALLITALGYGGVFTSFAYITPMMTHLAGFSENAIIGLLLLFGIGTFAGNLIGGKAADMALAPALATLLFCLSLTLFIFSVSTQNPITAIILIFLLGLFGFSVTAPMQAQIAKYAENAPTVSSAANISSFNIGIALGTYLGGVTIYLGWGYNSVNWVGGCMVLLALVIQIVNILIPIKSQ